MFEATYSKAILKKLTREWGTLDALQNLIEKINERGFAGPVDFSERFYLPFLRCEHEYVREVLSLSGIGPTGSGALFQAGYSLYIARESSRISGVDLSLQTTSSIKWLQGHVHYVTMDLSHWFWSLNENNTQNLWSTENPVAFLNGLDMFLKGRYSVNEHNDISGCLAAYLEYVKPSWVKSCAPVVKLRTEIGVR